MTRTRRTPPARRSHNRALVVARMIQEGMTNREIAAELGINISTVYAYKSYARAQGADVPLQSGQRTMEQTVRRVAELTAAGRTMEEIEQELGLTRGSHVNYRSRARAEGYDIPRAPSGNARGSQRVREVAELAIREGLTNVEIGRRLGIKPQTVENYRCLARKRLNLNVPPSPDARVPLFVQLAEMEKAGKTPDEIMAKLCLSRRTFYTHRHRARKLGLLPPWNGRGRRLTAEEAEELHFARRIKALEERLANPPPMSEMVKAYYALAEPRAPRDDDD